MTAKTDPLKASGQQVCRHEENRGRSRRDGLSRRDFLRSGSLALGALIQGIGLLGTDRLLASSPGGDPTPPPVPVFQLSVRGRRGSNASKKHNHFHFFASPEAADSHRAHDGDNSRIVSMLVSEKLHFSLFTQRGTAIADVRNLERIEPFPLPGAPGPADAIFKRGDVDGSGEVDLNDAVNSLNFLFNGSRPPDCPDAADADDNGEVELNDSIFTLGWRFLGTRPPPAPGPQECGKDTTKDALSPCKYDTGNCR